MMIRQMNTNTNADSYTTYLYCIYLPSY